MKTDSIIFILFLVILSHGFSATNAFAQASESELRSFPMPPAEGFAGIRHIRYTGDYYYPYANDYVPEFEAGLGSARPGAYTFYKLTGIHGKKVQIWPQVANLSALSPPYIDDRGRTRDSCGHVHLSYGVWIRYVANVRVIGFNLTFDEFEFAGGGGMSGVRNSSGRCTLEANGPLRRIDPRFGWGDEFTSITPRNTVIDFTLFGSVDLSAVGAATEVIVGVSAPSHGWNTCGTFQCFQPVRPYMWTLPP